MALSARHVGELVRELRPLLVGARLREVQAQPPRDLLLVLEAPGEGRIRRLRLSADARDARLHLQIAPLQRHTGPPGPFYRAANEALEGRTLTSLTQVGEDRLVRLAFGPPEGGDRDARPGEPEAVVIAELTGRHANLVLLDGRERVRAVLVVPSKGAAAAERLAPGRPWAAPPGRPPEGRVEPPLSEALPEPPEAPGPPGALGELAPLSWRVEAALGMPADRRHEDGARRELAQRLERRRKSAAHRLRGLEERERACAGADRLQQDGELLLAHLGELRRGQREAVLPDAHDPDGGQRTIALEARLSPRKNAERLFARAKKLRRTAEHLPAELAEARGQMRRLDELRERALAPEGDWRAVEEEALASGLLRPRQAAPARGAARGRAAPRLPYNRFRGLRGTEIRVGRSARDNDALSLKHARGNDLWLHTAEAPGSHVVLIVERGQEPDDEEVLDAAHLAIHFSPLRGTRRADVHVARCKHLKKPKGAPPGLVSLSAGRVRSVRVEEERLRRLLDTRPDAGPGARMDSGESA